MAISRRDALKRLEGLALVVEGHLDKIVNQPRSSSVRHWRHEVETWIEQVEAVLPAVGKKTAETWHARIRRWNEIIGDA
jgi:poly(3-hydroxyalkanoate) synthetase